MEKADKALSETIWIADSGASCCTTSSLKGMIDLKVELSNIKIGSEKMMLATKIGTYAGISEPKDGRKRNL